VIVTMSESLKSEIWCEQIFWPIC